MITRGGRDSGAGNYLHRTPERLVVNGLRLWAEGYEAGEIASWQAAWNLYAVILGPQQARPAITQLSHWVKAICIWRPERLKCLGVDCPFVCRDECLAVSMIAACQHDNGECLNYCADRLGGPAGQTELIESATGFALTLQGIGQHLLPVPQNVLRGLVEIPPTASYH